MARKQSVNPNRPTKLRQPKVMSPRGTPSTEAPVAAALLSGPRVFATQLQPTEPQWWRYLPVVVVSSLMSGVAYTLVVRHAASFSAAALGNSTPGVSTSIVNTLGSTFLGLAAFALMWGLGRLGAGKAGRAAEVYGASFALLPPLWLMVIILSLFTPAAAALPDAATAAALKGNAEWLQRAAYHATAQTQAAFLLMAVTILGTLAQFGLAFPALLTLTGRRSRAALGVLLPFLPALIMQIANVAPLISGMLQKLPNP